ncbi:hypothetical protein Q7P37_002384 [Cladosporium fusiforme]
MNRDEFRIVTAAYGQGLEHIMPGIVQRLYNQGALIRVVLTEHDRPYADPTCSICLDDVPEEQKGTDINNTTVCNGCLALVVERSINGDDKFPPTINMRRFNVLDFDDILKSDLIARYHQKQREYEVFPVNRVYCACGCFVGKLVKQRPGENFFAYGGCKNTTCTKLYCLICATLLSNNTLEGSIADHDCLGKLEKTRLERQALVDSLERGTNYQLCPTCHQIINLREACNHITCECGESFCYVCGESTSEASGHWDVQGGRCPRYGAVRPAMEELILPQDG